MSLPKIIIAFGNGNLLQDVGAIDGIGGIVGTVATVGLQGVVKTVFNLADAEDQGYTEQAETTMHRHLKEFYAEVGGNQELWIMGVADTQTLEDMVDDTNVDGAKKLINAAQGKIRLLAVFRNPPVDYDPGTDYIDADVAVAVTTSKTFAEARLTELQPIRILIEGRVVIANEASNTIYAPNTGSNGFAGVVLGGSANDGSASVGTALGRAVKYPAHIKIGKVANGSLALTTCYIGTKLIKELSNLEALHDKGYISFMTYAQKAGFYFGKDSMASTDDYRFLAHGRIIDKAAIITTAVYTEQIQSEVDVDTSGKISELDIEHLKGLIAQNINVAMAEQISQFDVYIDPNQNIVSTGKLSVKASIIPKGYTSEIDVTLSLSAGS
jgi:hypothetical protein